MGPSAPVASECPSCGAPDEGTASCRSCGLLRRKSAVVLPTAPFDAPARAPLPRGPVALDRPEAAWPYLAAGLVLAPVLTLTPILRYIGWFLASLVHETGHAAMSWWLGCPAFPAIRLDGHAAAVHGSQSIVLVVLVWVGVAAVGWRFREHGRARVAVGAALVLQPLLAFTHAHEGAFLVAGHLGELAFASVFLWRATTGGFTSSRAERGLYAALGFYLVGRNALLCTGLLWSDDVKATYASNGSFGMENDYVRLGREVLGCSTETVAASMLAVTACALALAFVLARAFPAPDR